MGCLIIELDWWVMRRTSGEERPSRWLEEQSKQENLSPTKTGDLWESFTHYIFTVLSASPALGGSPTHFDSLHMTISTVWWPQVSKNQLIPMTNVIRDKIVKNAFHDLCTIFLSSSSSSLSVGTGPGREGGSARWFVVATVVDMVIDQGSRSRRNKSSTARAQILPRKWTEIHQMCQPRCGASIVSREEVRRPPG